MRLTDETLAYIERIRAEERERCAKIAEERARIWRAIHGEPCEAKATEAEAIAHEIRNVNDGPFSTTR